MKGKFMDNNTIEEIIQLNDFEEWKEFMILYKFAIDEIKTKLTILTEHFYELNQKSPIEHINYRLKTPEKIAEKLKKMNLEPTIDNVKWNIHDIAGIRIVCSFTPEIYQVLEMLKKQSDIRILKIKDYVKKPKANGYRSLHLIVSIPIFLTDKTEDVIVEIQIRTISMDFWASLEHKIHYKKGVDISINLKDRLKDCAEKSFALEEEMQKINLEIQAI